MDVPTDRRTNVRTFCNLPFRNSLPCCSCSLSVVFFGLTERLTFSHSNIETHQKALTSLTLKELQENNKNNISSGHYNVAILHYDDDDEDENKTWPDDIDHDVDDDDVDDANRWNILDAMM